MVALVPWIAHESSARLAPVYEALDVIRYFVIRIGRESLKMSTLTSHLRRLTVGFLKERIARILREVCGESGFGVEHFALLERGSVLLSTVLLFEILHGELSLAVQDPSPVSLKELAKLIHDGSTDVDW